MPSGEPGDGENNNNMEGVTPSPKEYIVEVFYKKLQIYILPRNTGHLVLKKPSGVFVSRKATVQDYHRKIAEILKANGAKHSMSELLDMTRIWRLEVGEDVQEIET